jgi:hypothetical protein
VVLISPVELIAPLFNIAALILAVVLMKPVDDNVPVIVGADNVLLERV